ncbi:MAG: TetR family transcriptional regulator [Blastocatellia bacterium]
MARPKTEDPEARARILAAAERLFAERGLTGVAIREIASEAGVNGAMIHYYFGNKDGLYQAILENAASRVRSLIANATGSDASARERLTSFVSAYAEYIFTHPNLARILSREMLSGGQHITKLLQKYIPANYGMLREAMSEGVRLGEMRPIDVDLAPISLIGMILIFQFIRPLVSLGPVKIQYDEHFIKRLSNHTIDLFLNGAGEKAAGSKKKQRANKSK